MFYLNDLYYLKKKSMLKVSLLITLLLTLGYSLTHHQVLGTVSSAATSNGFSDFTGTAATPEMITSFTNFINTASSFYKDDVEANVQYIKEQLDGQYGTEDNNFFVIIQT